MNETAYVYMAGRYRLTDDVALTDIAHQLGTGLFAIMRGLDTTGSDFEADRVRLRQ